MNYLTNFFFYGAGLFTGLLLLSLIREYKELTKLPKDYPLFTTSKETYQPATIVDPTDPLDSIDLS